MSYTHNGRLYTDDGSLSTIFRGSIVARPQSAGGLSADAFGNVYIEHDSPGPLTRHDGICSTADGALFVTTDAPTVGNYRRNGIRFRADGAMHVTSGGPAAGDTTHNGWRISAAGQAYVTSSFQAKLADLGAGAADITTIFAAGSGTPTFTRATAAASKLSTGLWKLDVASGTARSHYIGLTTAVAEYGGYLGEGARTNSCLQSRDITNASWTKTTLTTAKTSTGIDGVGNSCTRCTASAGNGQATQAIVLASAAKTFSVWIKRVTGTGIVQISLDNFATNTDVTALINSVTFTLVQMTQTLANPTVGIRLVTSADAIDVDVAQLEDSASFASTPIPTTVAAVTRNTDVLTYPSAGNGADASGAFYAEASALWSSNTGRGQIIGIVNNNGLLLPIGASTAIGINDGTQEIAKSGISSVANAIGKRAVAYGGSTMSATGDGAAVASGAFDGTMFQASANISLGSVPNGSNPLFGTSKNIRIWTRQLPDAVLQSLTT